MRVYVKSPCGLVVVWVLMREGLTHGQVGAAEAGYRKWTVVQTGSRASREGVAERRGPHAPLLLQRANSYQRWGQRALREGGVILSYICKSSRYGFSGDMWHTNRQAAAMTAQVLYRLGGVVQGALNIGSGDQIFGSTKHLQHVCLSVVGGQVRFGQTGRTARFLHSVETTVNTLRDGGDAQRMKNKMSF